MKKVIIGIALVVCSGIAIAETSIFDSIKEYIDGVGTCMDDSLNEVVESTGHSFGATAAAVPAIIGDCIDGDKATDWSNEFVESSRLY